MDSLVAALSRSDSDIMPRLTTMLEALSHRGTDKCEIATPTRAASAKSLDELRKHVDKPSSLAIGHCMSAMAPVRSKQPLLAKDYAMFLAGYPIPRSSRNDHVSEEPKAICTPEKAGKMLLRDFDGAYTFATISVKRILLGRDSLGVMPLYYGASNALYAASTERKALWRIGLKETRSFPPGNLATMSSRGFIFEPIRTIKQPPQRNVLMGAATERLKTLLRDSVLRRVSDVGRVAVAFSGGLDSSIIARLAQECGAEVELISVGLEGQAELEHAKKAAEALNLRARLQAFRVSDVEKVLPNVLRLVEEADLMKIGVAIPLFWTARIASELGYHVLLTGQGADEVFGGYHRYLTMYAKDGVGKVAETLYNDTVMSYEANFQRDEPICAFFKVDLRLPYVDSGVVCFALSLPVHLKIESNMDGLRKRVLRHVAAKMGIPNFIANRPKKAVQFATGVDGALRSLAKSKGLTARRYVEELFQKTFPNVEVK